MKAAACAPAETVPVDSKGDRELAELAKAIAHPIRVHIVRILAKTTGCVNDLVEQLPLAQSTVSQHLKVLKDAGLVRGTVEGPRTCYCIDPAGLRRLRILVAQL